MTSTKLGTAGAYLIIALTLACTSHAKEQNAIVGSIPGDLVAKRMLSINAAETVDFIRMRIVLNEGDQSFELAAYYGIGKSNTRGFENGGKALAAKGNLEIKGNDGYLIYRLFSTDTGVDILLIRLNDQIFHVLSTDGRLLTGNGGWNYTLSRETETKMKSHTTIRATKTDISNDTPIAVFVGRTPCIEIAREQKIAITEDCFKLKWKLTLNRETRSGTPTTFTLQRTFRRPEPLEGTWQIVRDSGALIYRLKASDGTTITLQRIDDSLFFLDNFGRMLKGNGEFGYTLDKHRSE